MLVICALDACVTRDGTTQPRGTAFDRVVTNPDGSDYNPGPGLALVPDDGRALYVQNSGAVPKLPAPVMLPTHTNDADAYAAGLIDGQYYNNVNTGVKQLGASKGIVQ